ncbi:ComEC family competence protein [Clostridium saccharobutylicum]|uniref:ComEC/Rec2 family competence protein n=1 Tax=Clostridium saccharobutylicum TaxID=169679 RepID=UPI000983DFC8|nr:ComEC/Rec2 family competence protein [Clostridium saccharobutylicum]AQS08994.1 ComEC family competence protein [Clostridium saccharobutylicum]MBC2435498.1 ComEC/Rec2 family competence protein [Clostridium saccharobutylicum]NSB87227.1 competence protein ComEC [Clostridium saccharobutylicum]NYC28652.1 competence protein ComEC [Clostridium saccharobutylicum]OOM18334.1 ComEC family competence protein [Clostridium saccharobutylicum]
MISKKIEEVGNPIIYIFLSLAVSSICYGMKEDFRGLTIFIGVFFFICIFYYCGIKFSSMMIIFFLVGLYINNSYYNIGNKINGEVRIVKISSYKTIGSYEGENIILKNAIENLEIGEKYNITGEIEKVQDMSSGIVGEVKVLHMSKNNGDFIAKLYEIRKNIYYRLEKNLGRRKAGLISSIAFGYCDYLDPEDQDDMKNWGIIHSISVSGLHVVIVYGLVRKLMGRKLGLLATVFYVIFTGYNYPSIRAFVMLSSVEGAHILKRNNNSISALCLSAIILIIYKPYSIFEVSFDLSYLATLGIIILNKKFNNLMYKIPKKLRKSLSLTLSAQVFTLPYLMLIFKDFSMNFIVGNLMLVPFVDMMVVLGNVLCVVYAWSALFDFISYLNLNLIKIFDWTLNTIDKFSLPMFYGNEYVVFLYLFLLISIYFINKGYKKFIYLPFIAVFIIAVQLYSPIPNIKYYDEGAILVNYRGERILISNKNQIDLERLSRVAFATSYYRKRKSINIDNICNIKPQGDNYLLDTHNEKYLLKMISSKNESKDYGIINFKDGPTKRIFILDGKIIRAFQ